LSSSSTAPHTQLKTYTYKQKTKKNKESKETTKTTKTSNKDTKLKKQKREGKKKLQRPQTKLHKTEFFLKNKEKKNHKKIK
jgi:hypothetical protein